MSSTLLFARIAFDIKIHHPQSKEELLVHKKKKLSEIINFNTKINKLLKEAGKPSYNKDFEWHFAGIKEGNDYIYGKLGKEKIRGRLIIDEKKQDYIEDTTTEANIIYFLIDIQKSVMVYELKKDVGEKAPMDVFVDVFNQYHDQKEKIEIAPITDKREIINRMKKLTTLSHIELNLYPTNPDSTSGSDEMDKFLRGGNIKRLNLKAFSDDRGINLEGVKLLRSGFHLAEEGYGSAKAEGKVGKEREEIVTGDIPIKSQVNLHKESDELNIKALLKEIKLVLEKIGGRLNV